MSIMIKVTIFIILVMSMMLGITAITEHYPTAYAGKDYKKELCKENGGEWEDGGACDFKADDEDKADQFSDEVDKIRAFEEERAAEEDAETTNIPLCKSDDLMLGQTYAEKYNKENCEEHNGEWIDGECDFYENQMKEGWEVDEDNLYKEVCEDEKNESDECKKHRLSIEDGE